MSETMPPPSDPMGVARELLSDYQDVRGTLTLRYWRGGYVRWDLTHWADVERKAIEAWAYQRLEKAVYFDTDDKPKPWHPNRHKISDVLDALTAIIHLTEDTDAPAWLGKETSVPADEVIVCANTLLHVRTRTNHELTPRFFNRVAVPFDHEPNASRPVEWLRFLDMLWPNDPDSIAALQEFFGYVLSGRTDLHKIMLMIGPTRSGKGTIARVLTALVGKGNVAGPTLASMNTNFGLSPLIGKPLAVVSDARLGGVNAHQVVERLLSISGEDMLTIDRKYREPWTGKLPARFLIISNELPRFGDASGAIANRFVVLVMQKSFLGKEDHGLTAKLLKELPGILGWALDGFDRLTKHDSFTAPRASSDAILALQDLVSPVSAFVRDNCQTSPGLEIAVDRLFAAWKSWCEENGHRAGSVQSFGRDLRAVIPTLRVRQPRADGDRERRYVGLALSGAYIAEDRVPRVPGVPSASDTPDSEALARDGTRTSPMYPEPVAEDESQVRDAPGDDGGWPEGSIGAAENPLRRVRCPSCGWQFKTAVEPGEQAWCKKCSHEFTVPGKDTQ